MTGIALRSALSMLDIPFSFWTIVVGHATFCVVVVYNNVLARFRRTARSLVEASMDLGASGFETFRFVVLPQLGTAPRRRRDAGLRPLLRRDHRHHVHRGQQETLPIWIFNQLTRPRQRPVTNVVAVFVVLVTALPILLAHRLTREGR